MAIDVELLVDHGKDSIKARDLLYGLHRQYSPKIQVKGIPANGYTLPTAFCFGFTYRGIEGIERLHKRLLDQIEEGKIPV